MAFTEHLEGYFVDFGEIAKWQNRQVNVIFDNEYSQNLEMAGKNPVVTVKEADMPGVKRGQSLVINGKTYVIQSPPQPDGQGLMRLELEKQ
jgi:hypothetical protein